MDAIKTMVPKVVVPNLVSFIRVAILPTTGLITPGEGLTAFVGG